MVAQMADCLADLTDVQLAVAMVVVLVVALVVAMVVVMVGALIPMCALMLI